MNPSFAVRSDLPALGVAVLICFGASLLAQVATFPNIPTWYAGLIKPDLTPPNRVFGPVWSALYLFMAIALWLVWRAPDGPARRRALALFAVQLAFNVAWSFAFFAARSPLLGLAVIAGLLGAVVATALAMRPVNRVAAALFVPYIAWVGFASWLNLRIAMLNP
jgi:tryptophan-rich sensory protein